MWPPGSEGEAGKPRSAGYAYACSVVGKVLAPPMACCAAGTGSGKDSLSP